jgi:thiosulfate/3-mercaptopyruvate sulfurtransferase
MEENTMKTVFTMKEFRILGFITLLLVPLSNLQAKQGFKNADMVMSAQALSSQINDPKLRIIDARDAAKYEVGHIPGAVNIPISTVSRSEILGNGKKVKALVMHAGSIQPVLRAAGINANDRVVIYTDGDSRAARVWWVLDYYGHKNLAILNGGIKAWEAGGGEVDIDDVEVAAGNFTPKANSRKIADYKYVNSRLNDKNTVLIDAVSPEKHAGGHIPGSGSAFYEDTFDTANNGVLKSVQKLENLLQKAGISKDDGKEAIFYCGGGWYSAQDLFVARALGYKNVRLYDGSRKDWTARDGKMVTASQ